jgi:hypothetical protein
MLENLTGVSSEYETTVRTGKTFLFTLKPINANVKTNFNYTSSYIRGCTKTNIDKDFKYLLPIGNGKITKPSNLSFFKLSENDPEPKDWYALSFKMDSGDTIFAARRGIVCTVKDTENIQYTGISMSTQENVIEIFHNDCTFGRYNVLKKSLLKEGQEVEAGDPIAIAGGENYTSGVHLRFQVYYNFEQLFDNKDSKVKKHYWAYVPLVFHTKEGTGMLTIGQEYTCEKHKEIITQEMTKRQQKKRARQN